MASTSAIRQNFSAECENGINKQLNLELYASYVYLSMAYYFDRDDIALPGMHLFCKKSSDDEREHAMKFMKYLNKRGGNIILEDIKKPEKNEWGGAHDAMTSALQLERRVNVSLLALHGTASAHKDEHFCDFLSSEFLDEQVNSMKQISDHVTNLERVGEGLGVFIFDKNLKKELN